MSARVSCKALDGPWASCDRMPQAHCLVLQASLDRPFESNRELGVGGGV